LRSILRALGPESSLQRGYSITFDEKGEVLRDARDVRNGMKITTRLAEGQIISIVSDPS
jgi:exodeoxyribonuclease VII large subunit